MHERLSRGRKETLTFECMFKAPDFERASRNSCLGNVGVSQSLASNRNPLAVFIAPMESVTNIRVIVENQ